jgi:hypothetical protein
MLAGQSTGILDFLPIATEIYAERDMIAAVQAVAKSG